MDEMKLEQLIRDFMAVGREFLELLRGLIDVEEDNDDQPQAAARPDEEGHSNRGGP